jgi:hypothetical protein
MVATAVDDILKQAVREKGALRVAFVDGTPASHNAKALQLSDKAGAEGLWIHLPEADEATIGRFARSLSKFGFTLAAGKQRFSFESKVIARNPRFWFNDTVMLDALLVSMPDEVREVQERRQPRLPVSEGSGVTAQLFRLDKSAAATGNPTAAALVPVDGKLQDLSLTGGGFLCSPDRTLMAAKRGERLACIVEFRGTKLLLVASLARITNISNRAIRIGIDFAAHQDERAMTGKLEQLASVVQELERQESLRRR